MAKKELPSLRKEDLLQHVRDLSEEDRTWLAKQLVEEEVQPFDLLKKFPRTFEFLTLFGYALGRASRQSGERKPAAETLQKRANIWNLRKQGQSIGQIAKKLGKDTDSVKKDLKRTQENIAEGWLVPKDGTLVLGNPVEELASLLEIMQRMINRFFPQT